MATNCYSPVRGSAIRVTALDKRGRLGDPSIRYAVSRTTARVQIDEVTEGGSNEVVKNDEEERRLLLVQAPQTIRHVVGLDFLRVDPGLLNLVSGLPIVRNAAGDVTGFDSKTKLPAASFALEVWTRLAGQRCADRLAGFGEMKFGEGPFGGSGMITPVPQWGYTLFPFLKGGVLTGFAFNNGLVSFNLRAAQTRRGSKWGSGPYSIDGPRVGLPSPVSRNLSWKNFLITSPPPEQTDGVVEFTDIIDGGTATMTSSDILDGGTAALTSPLVVDGGIA